MYEVEGHWREVPKRNLGSVDMDALGAQDISAKHASTYSRSPLLLIMSSGCQCFVDGIYMDKGKPSIRHTPMCCTLWMH